MVFLDTNSNELQNRKNKEMWETHKKYIKSDQPATLAPSLYGVANMKIGSHETITDSNGSVCEYYFNEDGSGYSRTKYFTGNSVELTFATDGSIHKKIRDASGHEKEGFYTENGFDMKPINSEEPKEKETFKSFSENKPDELQNQKNKEMWENFKQHIQPDQPATLAPNLYGVANMKIGVSETITDDNGSVCKYYFSEDGTGYANTEYSEGNSVELTFHPDGTIHKKIRDVDGNESEGVFTRNGFEMKPINIENDNLNNNTNNGLNILEQDDSIKNTSQEQISSLSWNDIDTDFKGDSDDLKPDNTMKDTAGSQSSNNSGSNVSSNTNNAANASSNANINAGSSNASNNVVNQLNWNQSSNSIYFRYRNTISMGGFNHAKGVLLHKAGVDQTETVRGWNNIKKFSTAAGLGVAASYIRASYVVKNITQAETAVMADSILYLRNKGKIDNHADLKITAKALDKEILARTGVDLRGLSYKSTLKLVKEGKLQGIKVPRKGTVQIEDETGKLIYSALMSKKLIETKGRLTMSIKGQVNTIEQLIGRMSGDDVDFFNGIKKGKEVHRTYKSVKRYAKYGKKGAQYAYKGAQYVHKAALNNKTYKAIATITKNTANKVLNSKPGQAVSKTAKAASNAVDKARNAVNATKLAVKSAFKIGGTASGAATGTAAGATAATAGAAATGGAATTGGLTGATVASGGTIWIPIAIAAAIIAVMFLFMFIGMTVSYYLPGALQGDGSDGKNPKSMMQKCYEVLEKHDNELMKQIEKGFAKSEAKDYAINIYDDLEWYYANGYGHPVLADGIEITPARNSKGKVLASCYNGDGTKLPYFASNAKDILAATTVVIDNDYAHTPQTAKRYAENLWYDTHNMQARLITNDSNELVLTFCNGNCMNKFLDRMIYEIKIDNEQLFTYDCGNGVVVTVRYVMKYFDDGNIREFFQEQTTDFWYNNYTETNSAHQAFLAEQLSLYNQGNLLIFQSYDSITAWEPFDGTFKNGYYYTSQTISEVEKQIAAGKLVAYEKNDESLFNRWNVVETSFDGDSYLKEGKEYKFCAGHATYEVGVITNYLTDTNADAFFAADTFTNDPANADFWNGKEDSFLKTFFADMGLAAYFVKLTNDTNWNGEIFFTYNPSIIQDVIQDYDIESIEWDKWTDFNKDLAQQYYLIDWNSYYDFDFDSTVLSDSQTEKILGSVEGEIEDILRFALGTVGRIPYYWGGKQVISASYIDYPDMSVSEFMTTYYPHLGTRKVSTSNGNPVSYNGWYGCGGIDEKRNIIGLDCSGWVSFVFNNFGIEVGAGTGGLSTTGTAVSFSDLKPGDLLIDHSSNAHVVIFVSWDNAEHTKYTTVECAGSSGVVVKSGVTKSWEYYRRVLE